MRLFSFLAFLPIGLVPVANQAQTPTELSVRLAATDPWSAYQKQMGIAKEGGEGRDRVVVEPSRKADPERAHRGGDTRANDPKEPVETPPGAPTSTTPEPATVFLLGTGLAAAVVGQRLRRRNRA